MTEELAERLLAALRAQDYRASVRFERDGGAIRMVVVHDAHLPTEAEDEVVARLEADADDAIVILSNYAAEDRVVARSVEEAVEAARNLVRHPRRPMINPRLLRDDQAPLARR